MDHSEQAKILFDRWALTNRVEQMKDGHRYSVNTYLETVNYKSSNFNFLDVGCGDGWVVRKFAKDPECNVAYGIDLSPNMITCLCT